MKVREIVKASAELLNMKDVVKYLDGDIEESDEINESITNFVLAVNMVNNNIASSYIDLIGESNVYNNGDKVHYSDITSNNIIEIRNVYNVNGDNVDFKVMPDGLVLSSGDYKIVYSYYPESLTIDSKIDYYLKLNELTFALGVVGEYLFIKGAVDDAYMWDKRFKNAMFNVLRPKKNIILPARRWE